MQEDPEEMRWDQKILEEIIDKFGSKLKIVKLPVTYCQKFDDRTLSLEDAVILHTQASRRLKKEINGE